MLMILSVVVFIRRRISRRRHATCPRVPNQGAVVRKRPHQQSEGAGHEAGQGPQEAVSQAGTHQQPGLLTTQRG